MIYNSENLSFQFLTIDRFVHKPGCFKVEGRPYAALSFRVSGEGNFKINDKRFFVKRGDVLFIPSNVFYEVEYSDSESIVIHLQNCNYGDAEAFDIRNSAELSWAFTQALEAWRESRSVNGAKSAIYAIFDKIERDQRGKMENTAFARCVRYMESDFCDPSLDIGNICDKEFVSVSSLQRAFIRHLGISPMQYVIRLRMNKAFQLLVENKLSIKEISFACGFSDEKYFSRAFKKRYGFPPSSLHNNVTL